MKIGRYELLNDRRLRIGLSTDECRNQQSSQDQSCGRSAASFPAEILSIEPFLNWWSQTESNR
ncbi:MAG TPA: hypothetical protein VG271_11320, partial [Beijerinckiaceae bacterium]|nr:hypothetical protein [Beijerinckiaceae bacterium]